MKKFYTHKVIINKEQNLQRLDRALASQLEDFTRSQIKILLENQNVEKSGLIIKESAHKVKSGEEYIIYVPKTADIKFEAEDIPLDIKFEDEDIIVINKSPGIVTHPAPGNQTGTLVNALLQHTKNKLSYLNETSRPGIVHRLDKFTSGLIVVAKNNTSHLALSEQFKIHSILRKYKALVWGTPKDQIIKGFIERHKINRKRMSFNLKERGKFSETKINLIKNFGICSLVECKLETGRTHQVRLHLSHIGSPIIGDKIYGKNSINKYGKDKKTFNKFLILKNFDRQALHAFKLGFNHPKSKKYIEFESNLPKDIKQLLEVILKY